MNCFVSPACYTYHYIDTTVGDTFPAAALDLVLTLERVMVKASMSIYLGTMLVYLIIDTGNMYISFGKCCLILNLIDIIIISMNPV